jgi:hypothetical protein
MVKLQAVGSGTAGAAGLLPAPMIERSRIDEYATHSY